MVCDIKINDLWGLGDFLKTKLLIFWKMLVFILPHLNLTKGNEFFPENDDKASAFWYLHLCIWACVCLSVKCMCLCACVCVHTRKRDSSFRSSTLQNKNALHWYLFTHTHILVIFELSIEVDKVFKNSFLYADALRLLNFLPMGSRCHLNWCVLFSVSQGRWVWSQTPRWYPFF